MRTTLSVYKHVIVHITALLGASGVAFAQGQESGSSVVSDNNTTYLSNSIPLSSIGPVDSEHISKCFDSFNETKNRVREVATQSVVVLSNPGGIAPYITLQSLGDNGNHYTLWQTLNGEIKGYALRNGKGFDYNDSAMSALPLSWHPTFIWDSLFASDKALNNFSCIFMGRTRVMGKKVSILRLMPQENLRYSYLLAKEDESDFPVELTVLDPNGTVIERMTTMDSRTVTSLNFPIHDEIFDRFEQDDNTIKSSQASAGSSMSGKTKSSAYDSESALAGATNSSVVSNNVQPTVSAGAAIATAKTNVVKIKPWKELQLPNVYKLVASGKFEQGGPNCYYQEFSDGLTSFRVYKNEPASVMYPVLTNGTISVVRKKTVKYEYSVVGEVPITLAEYVLTRING